MSAIRRLPAALLIAVSWTAGGCTQPASTPTRERILINAEPFELELANDDASRAYGLMGRTEIPPYGGMLFIFPDADIRSFWMGDCLVDIDIIFLDPQGRVTATHQMRAEPPRRAHETNDAYRSRLAEYSSVHPAQFAIELAAGTLKELNLEVEDKIALDLRRLKALAR